MKFEIEKRNETARIGWIEYKSRKIEIPAILWYSSPRIPAPIKTIRLGRDIKASGTFFHPKKGDIPPSMPYPYFFPQQFHDFASKWNESNATEFEIIDVKGNVRKEEKIYILQNAVELYSNPKYFVEAITEVRQKIGYKPLYAPAIALPSNLAILIYAGIDIVDSIAVVLKTRKGIYLTGEGEHKIEEIEEYPCSCKYCRKGINDFRSLLMHNYEAMKNEMAKVRNAIKNDSLRRLVEGKAVINAHIATILRLLDEKYNHFEKIWPIHGNKINASCYSLNMPPIKRFRERIIKRYEKPDVAKILLLLPCSSKKPYSISKSHTLFRKVINKISNKNVIHEVILTSPLGIVPRELENFYPAAHYDISVTGYWNREEKEMLQSMLDEYLAKNKYDAIISHLPKEMNFLSIDAISTCHEKPTGRDELKRLEKILHELSEEYEHVYPSWRRKAEAKSMLLFQFGSIGEFGECIVRGKFPEYKIYCNDKQAGVYVAKRGLFSLTLVGARKLGRNYWVEIDDFIPKGSIFAIGVKDADERIRSGDEVVVFHNGELRGIGVAKMNGSEMIESRHGEAVKIRHHV